MELNLKDLGATLVTGAYFLFGLFSVLCLIFGWNFFFFINLARRVSSAGLTILTLSIAFGAGMLLEDLSNKFVDSGAARVPILDCQLLPHDEDLRAETLFGMKFIAAQGRVIDGSSRAAGLGRQAAEMGILADYGPEGAAAQQAVSSKQPNATAEQLTKAASRLYYDAKNTVYRIDNHYNELKQIQTRIDFSRSFALLSVTLAFIGICFAALALIFQPLGAQIAKRFDRRSKRDQRVLTRSAVIARVISLTILLVTIFFLCRFAYLSEEIEFDKRAYGYFFSLLKKSSGITPVAVETTARRIEARGKETTPSPLSMPIGYSGMVLIEKTSPSGASQTRKPATFLMVHDTKRTAKAEMEGARLGTLLVQAGSTPLYTPIAVDWGAERPNDFEAVCPLPPPREREFLVTESGDGGPGRIFHIVLTKGLEQWNASVKGTIDLPKDTENIEGIACVANKTGRLTLLLGERGGSERNPTGRIRWGMLDLVDYRLQMLGERSFTAPSSFAAGQKKTRACADLYIDAQHRLWSVATQDQSDDGPFRSVIYQAGTIDPDGAEPVQLLVQTTAAWIFEGVKVEGLAPSPIENSPMSIATDDENYEGIWRPLFPAR